MGKQHNLLTLPDLIQVRYRSRALSTIVAIVAVLALIPYVTLQLSALQIFLTVAGHGAIDPVLGACVAFLLDHRVRLRDRLTRHSVGNSSSRTRW